jgi:hypothetical protein
MDDSPEGQNSNITAPLLSAVAGIGTARFTVSATSLNIDISAIYIDPNNLDRPTPRFVTIIAPDTELYFGFSADPAATIDDTVSDVTLAAATTVQTAPPLPPFSQFDCRPIPSMTQLVLKLKTGTEGTRIATFMVTSQ